MGPVSFYILEVVESLNCSHCAPSPKSCSNSQKSYSESPKSYSEKSYSEKSISHPRRLSSPIDKNTAVNISQKKCFFFRR